VRRAFSHGLAALVPLALASCGGAAAGAPATVALTRVGEAVQVTENAASARECEYIAELPLRNRSVSDVNTMRTLQNDAGESGANLVLLVMETRTTIARAEGYLCAD
jgi:hypothetical protein